VREPSPRIARFCSILGVSRGASGRSVSLPGSGSLEWCAARRSASVSISMRRTSSSTTPSSSGDLCFPLLTGTFVGASRNFLFGGCDGPASALPLEDGCEDGGWDWEPRIMTRPLRCSSPLITNQNGPVLRIKRVYINKTRTFALVGYRILFHNIQQSQSKQYWDAHIVAWTFGFRCAIRVCGVVVRGLAFARSLGRVHGPIRIAGNGRSDVHRHESRWWALPTSRVTSAMGGMASGIGCRASFPALWMVVCPV
jgi:hypothetical protein